MLEVYDLRTEYLVNPMGIDAGRPRFSWKLRSDGRGVFQKSYHIMAMTGDRVIWDSGVVESEACLYIRYEGEALESRQQVRWKVEITAEGEGRYREAAESGVACFEMGLLAPSDWKARWIEPEDWSGPEARGASEDNTEPGVRGASKDCTEPEERSGPEADMFTEARKPAPYLRKKFTVKPGLVKARIYQTAHGLYEFWINGFSGTRDKFKPGLTSYYHRIQYHTCDITGLLHTGGNVWAVALGDGWWRGVTGGTVKNNFGYKLHYFGQIELEYADGAREIIPTDESFLHSTGGLRASDMLMGDIYDASLEPEGWKLPEFDDRGWSFVHTTKEHADARLIPCRGAAVREKEEFLPEEFIDGQGRRILDFGQNIAGYVRMRVRNCRKGQTIRLVHGEDIKDGCFSLDNIRQTSIQVDAFQEVTYICEGNKEEEYCPMFSVFGFRYVLVEGYDGAIKDGDFMAVAVYSDMEETGDFVCSNPLINKLVENSRWSQKGNFLDAPVDCPTRERNTWTGDNQIYVRTAAYFMNVYAFYEKWLQDQAIEQYESGKVGITFPSTSSIHNPAEFEKAKAANPLYAMAGPEGNGSIGEDCAGWGDSAAWLPYMIYLCYGDRQILENQYGTAKKWADYMLACAKDHNPMYEDQPQYHTYNADGELEADYIYDTRMHYGEWQEPIPKAPEGNNLGEIFARWIKEGKPLVATAYMCRSVSNVAHMAQMTGRMDDYEKYTRIAQKIRGAYEKYLIADDGMIEPGHQAAYVRALAMDLCSGEKRAKVIGQLIHEIEANDYKLNTGFLSTPFLLPVLEDCGYTEVAFKILEQTKSPSWLHPVLLGATTILEGWEGMDDHAGSFNHYSFGAVCEFLFGRVAGIEPDFDAPGYKKFTLRPVMGGSLTRARATYESLYGTIVSGWKRNSGGWQYSCEIPANTRARVILPDGREMLLGSGRYSFSAI